MSFAAGVGTKTTEGIAATKLARVAEKLRTEEASATRQVLAQDLVTAFNEIRVMHQGFGSCGDTVVLEKNHQNVITCVHGFVPEGEKLYPYSPYSFGKGAELSNFSHRIEAKVIKNVIEEAGSGWRMKLIGLSFENGHMTPYLLAEQWSTGAAVLTPLSLLAIPNFDTQDHRCGCSMIINFDCLKEVPDGLQESFNRHFQSGELRNCGEVAINASFVDDEND